MMEIINKIKIKNLDLSFILLDFNNSKESIQYFKLFECCFGKRKNITPNTFNWFNVKIPNKNFNFALIDNSNNTMIAAYGLAPVKCYYKNNHTPTVLCTNVMTNPKYSGNGLFVEIGKLSLANVFDKKNIKLAYGIPNENAIRGHLKVGWKEMPLINFFEKHKSDIKKINTNKIEYKTIETFEESINNRLDYFYKKYDFYIYKNAEFLNWRFSKPTQSYKKILLLENGNIQGYIVYKFYVDNKMSLKKLQIIDFLYNNSNHLTNLLKIINNIAYQNDIDLINLWVISEQELFIKNNYQKSKENNMFILYSKEKNNFNDLKNIHITLADNDVF